MSEVKPLLSLFPVEDYHPQQKPRSLHIILGKQESQQKKRKLEVKTVTISQFNMLAVKVRGTMKNFEAGQEIRKGWKRLQKIITDNLISVEENEGIVFYDQVNMLQPDGTIELWIGVNVSEIVQISDDCKCFIIPKRKYAKIDCRCFSRAEMESRYNCLAEWIKEKGYEIDNATNAFSLEPNRLETYNPFEVPAHEIQAFDFDILYPIK